MYKKGKDIKITLRVKTELFFSLISSPILISLTLPHLLSYHSLLCYTLFELQLHSLPYYSPKSPRGSLLQPQPILLLTQISSCFISSFRPLKSLPCIKQAPSSWCYLPLPWFLLQSSYLLSVSPHYCQGVILFFPEGLSSSLALSNHLLNDWLDLQFLLQWLLPLPREICRPRLFLGHRRSRSAFPVTNVSTKVIWGLLPLSHCSDIYILLFFTSQANEPVF